MSLFKKPSELEAKPGIVAMIYGQPGCGKSTLACSAPGAVMIDTDGGVMRINGAHQVPTLQVKGWSEIDEAVKEVASEPSIKSVVIDTVGKMLTYMEKDIIKNNPKMGKDDGLLTFQGYGVRKARFSGFVKNLTTTGRNVIFVAHDKEERDGDARIVRPEVGGSATADLMKELDLVGYMEMNGNDRTISFTPTDKYYAKNTCDMPGVIQLPALLDAEGASVKENNFFAKVIENYHKRIEKSLENNRKLEELKGLIDVNAGNIANAEDANNYVAWVNGLEHIYNSKAYAGKALRRKVAELGLKYDKINKVYSDADTNAVEA